MGRDNINLNHLSTLTSYNLNTNTSNTMLLQPAHANNVIPIQYQQNAQSLLSCFVPIEQPLLIGVNHDHNARQSLAKEQTIHNGFATAAQDVKECEMETNMEQSGFEYKKKKLKHLFKSVHCQSIQNYIEVSTNFYLNQF